MAGFDPPKNVIYHIFELFARLEGIEATEHYAIEASEGFGRIFSYIMNTLEVIGK